MLINFVDATNGANHYTKPPLRSKSTCANLRRWGIAKSDSLNAHYKSYRLHVSINKIPQEFATTT